MIKRLKLKNFRGIKKGEIELAPLTILVGSNNSGKTAILEALYLFPNPFRKAYAFDTALDVVHSIHKTLDSEGYSFLLYNYISDDAEIECEVNGNKRKLKLTNRRGEAINFTTNYHLKSRGKKVDLLTEEPPPNFFGVVSISSRTHGSVYDKTTLIADDTLLIRPDLIKEAYVYLHDNWASITNLGVCRKVAKESSTLSHDTYKDFTLEPHFGKKNAFNAYFEDGRRIRLGDLGEGMQSYIVARILYELWKPGVLLWDDVEAHFNPKMLLKVAEWLQDLLDEGKQAVISTHSIEAVKMIAGLNEEKAVIYLTSLEEGVLKARKLNLKEFEELLVAGIDIRLGEPLLI